MPGGVFRWFGGPDPTFLNDLVHTVDVRIDANAAGKTTTRHGGIPLAVVPVDGLSALRCLCVEASDRQRDNSFKPGAEIQWIVLFGDPIANTFTQANRFIFFDASGNKHTLLVRGQPRDEGFGHHWVCRCVEHIG